ncbi:hypothetical protein [Saccharopolyspora flava]|uniref:Uncharacterized protein n=1 Tax=Saccharopolyspora flava TaxID=95161 RepID=A0A1I6P5H8_9PSEU|nr:hypothetical protein [Saccharopolyspora flava]SFS35473.1 hypothetical protein SAMN05660874_00478 [Saccharopolyspora flava]
MRTELWAPSDSAKIVRYREGWGFLAAMVFLLAFAGLFLAVALFPDEIVTRKGRDFAPYIGWFFTVLFGPLSLLGVAGGVGMVTQVHRIHVDERGLWLHIHGKADLISWSELRAIHGRLPRPKVKDDPNSKPVQAALLFQPVDEGFAGRHGQILDKRQPDPPQITLPGKSVVQRITRAVAELRPDLVR